MCAVAGMRLTARASSVRRSGRSHSGLSDPPRTSCGAPTGAVRTRTEVAPTTSRSVARIADAHRQRVRQAVPRGRLVVARVDIATELTVALEPAPDHLR